MRTKAEKAKHAAAERRRYATLKRGLIQGIALRNGRSPFCTMLVERISPLGTRFNALCGIANDLEIDHRYGSKFTQREMNSVQRLERFAIEFVRWVGGDAKCELRLACRSCNAKHQPKRRKR